MKRMLPRVLLGIFIFIIVIGIGLLLAAPRVDNYQPNSEQGEIPSSSPLMITFNKPMDIDSVASHLETNPRRVGSFEQQGNTVVFNPDIPWISSAFVTVTLKAGARNTFGLPLLRTLTWKFYVPETRLAYLWPFEPPSDIYLLEPHSGKVVRLTTFKKGVNDFDVSLDGRMIYFSAENDQGGSDIYSLDLLDKHVIRILECGHVHCSGVLVSPDNRFLAFQRADGVINNENISALWLMNLLNKDTYIVSEAEEGVDDFGWHPMGKLVYFIGDRNLIRLVDPDSNERQEFEIDSESLGVWSPDGTLYLTTTLIPVKTKDVDAAISSHLLLYNLLSKQSTDLTEGINLEDATPAFSPNGDWIAFGRKYLDASDWTPGRQLWLVKIDGSNTHALTNEPDLNHVNITWSPDGKYIAFICFNQVKITAPPEVWMIDVEGKTPVRLVINAYAPQWIP
ncbi:MAG TPA: hypothetical protein G4N95_00505 [Anaerolineae bacterium]|nr:hypothetical protein [Anaerolineae bacterium]